MGVRLFLDKLELDLSEDHTHILGQGGSGTTIYRAKYQGRPVAVKRFHFKKDQRQTMSDTGTRSYFLWSGTEIYSSMFRVVYMSTAEFRKKSNHSKFCCGWMCR